MSNGEWHPRKWHEKWFAVTARVSRNNVDWRFGTGDNGMHRVITVAVVVLYYSIEIAWLSRFENESWFGWATMANEHEMKAKVFDLVYLQALLLVRCRSIYAIFGSIRSATRFGKNAIKNYNFKSFICLSSRFSNRICPTGTLTRNLLRSENVTEEKRDTHLLTPNWDIRTSDVSYMVMHEANADQMD